MISGRGRGNAGDGIMTGWAEHGVHTLFNIMLIIGQFNNGFIRAGGGQ